MISDPYKYRSYWYTEDIYKDYFSAEAVDNILAAVSVVTEDPASPASESAWILKSGAPAIPDGVPMGLLLALTYTGDVGSGTSYQFSYKDRNNVINRLPIV